MQRVLVGLCIASAAVAAGVAAAKPPPSPYAARVEGYLGAAVIDPDGFDDEAFVNGGGAGSIVGRFGPLHLQGDVFGDWTDIDPDVTNVGGGGHLGLSDPDLGAIGATGAYQSWDVNGFDNEEFFRAGAEGELYLDAVTLGAQAGYLNALDDDGYYARGLLRFYPTEQLKLEGIGGVASIESDVIPHARVLVEYRPQGWPVGLFARWEGAFDDFLDQHLAVAGFRLYLPGMRFDSPLTLRETDRVYFREACVHFIVFTRTC